MGIPQGHKRFQLRIPHHVFSPEGSPPRSLAARTMNARSTPENASSAKRLALGGLGVRRLRPRPASPGATRASDPRTT
eukprot:13837690-Heterocapsa_arctica.AAC.1